MAPIFFRVDRSASWSLAMIPKHPRRADPLVGDGDGDRVLVNVESPDQYLGLPLAREAVLSFFIAGPFRV